jgi:signal transduction histidine kinase
MSTTETPGADPHAVRANKLDLLERLADDLAHEIKNPLHSMVINLEVLKRKIGRLGEPGGDLMRYAEVLGGELERVSRRVELLLRLVRPGRGGEPTTLAEVVQELLELVEMERDRHEVALSFRPAAYLLPGYLPRDTARQLVLNLMLEGLDGVPAGGVLEVHTEREGEWERLRLLGTLPAETDPAGRAEDGGSRLLLVRTLCEALGGRLEVGAGAAGSRQWALALPLRAP